MSRDELIENNTELVGWVIKKYKNSVNASMTYDDLYSIGIMGLIRAADMFDESKGLKFSTYAVPSIRNEILNEFRKQNQTKRKAVCEAALQEGYNNIVISNGRLYLERESLDGKAAPYNNEESMYDWLAPIIFKESELVIGKLRMPIKGLLDIK